MICPNCKETYDINGVIWCDPYGNVYCSEECVKEGGELLKDAIEEKFGKRVFGKLSKEEMEEKYDTDSRV